MNWNIDYRGRVDAMESAIRTQLEQQSVPSSIIDATITLFLAMAEGSQVVTIRYSFTGGGAVAGRGSLMILVNP